MIEWRTVMSERNIALIFAGGVGRRMRNGAMPKQFLELNGKAIIIYTLDVFEMNNNIDDIIVVCVEGWEKHLKKLIDEAKITKVRSIVTGGRNPQESQFIGMNEIEKSIQTDENTTILLHDGVRPLVDDETINQNIESVKKYGSAITTTPAIETIVSVEDRSIDKVAKRSDFMMAKAPQSYRFKEVFAVYKRAFKDKKTDFIDSAELMHSYGKDLYPVTGSTNNIKITTPVDFFIFKGILEAKNQENIFGR